ncbi:Hypothetical_protein [Hexamita inflata]|uniref:Hypothetical_protein n=1 Tax=Hexamita inflata TaxID=28002 RepID=A0AA86NUG0_9EUKA|nr:Hypothetical protein HINF_LOCUS13102 [Hexamita inflata]
MQTIIRSNHYNGTDPTTGEKENTNCVETAFVRVPFHTRYHQVYLGTTWHTKVTKNFFVECDMCYGYGSNDYKIYPGLQTVIFLNSKFSSSNGAANHNGANPQIYIETIDESCKQFTAAEKAAGRSVTELTIKVLCEQLKLIQISETEKLELINGFIQRRCIQNEEVFAALCANGFDCSDFVLKEGISNDQVIVAMAKNNVDYSNFALKNNISNEQILTALAKSDQDYQTFAQSKGFTDEQTLITLMKAEIDLKPFIQSKNISTEQIISIIKNSDLPLSDKYDLLQQITPVDLRSEQEDIHNALIKREYELTNDRVLKFVNNKQRELILEIVFKEALLKQKKNQEDFDVNEIAELKLKNQELQKLNLEIKLECEQKIAEIKTQYEAELIKCKNEVESLRKEYQLDLQKEYEKYKNEIEELKKTYEIQNQNSNKIQQLKQKQLVSDQEVDMNDTIANQLQMECQILKQQLIDEKQFYSDQQELTLQLVNRANQRNNDIQKQLTEEKTQRLLFFQQLQQKQSEITKQLEATVQEQASRIVHLENKNQSLQSTLKALREQIEKLNQEYQRRIDLQIKQLEDKDEYISKLKEEMEKINVNQLQDKQIEKVLNILKSVGVSQ